MLTSRQRQVLDFIIGYQTANGGVSPSLEEIRRGMGLAPKRRSSVFFLVERLIERGYLRKLGGRNRHRNFEVLNMPATEVKPPAPEVEVIAFCRNPDDPASMALFYKALQTRTDHAAQLQRGCRP